MLTLETYFVCNFIYLSNYHFHGEIKVFKLIGIVIRPVTQPTVLVSEH